MFYQIYFPLTKTSIANIRLEFHHNIPTYSATTYKVQSHNYDETRDVAEQIIIEEMQTDPHDMFDTLYNDSISEVMNRMIDDILDNPNSETLDIPNFARDAFIYDADNEINYTLETSTSGQIYDKISNIIDQAPIPDDQKKLVEHIIRNWKKSNDTDFININEDPKDQINDLIKPFNDFKSQKPEDLAHNAVQNFIQRQ